MHNFKRGLGLALLLFVWVIMLYFGTALLVAIHLIPVRFAGIAQDSVVLLGVWLFNHYLAHVPVSFWQWRHGWRQFKLMLPALVLVGLLFSANLPKLLALPFSNLVLLYFGYVVLIGLTEEYVFRGVLIPIIARTFPKNNLVVVVLSSVLFGGLHLINTSHISVTYVLPQVFFAMALGTLFASLYVSTNNLGLPILLHATTDLSLIVQLIKHPTSTANLNVSSQVSVAIAIFYGVLFIIAVMIAARQTRGVKIKSVL